VYFSTNVNTSRDRHHAPQHLAQQVDIGGGVAPGIDRDHRAILAGGEPRQAEQGHHRRQGDDEGLQPADHDDQTVDRTDHQADARHHEKQTQNAEFLRAAWHQPDRGQRRRQGAHAERQPDSRPGS
jgi:hypothetical protein